MKPVNAFAIVAAIAMTGLATGWARAKGDQAAASDAPWMSDSPSKESFLTPPKNARPRVWWHWVDGNVTEEGITKDLEWMKRVGIGGFQMFDVSVSVDQYVKNPVNFFSKEWFSAINHAAETARRLDLDMAIHTGGGWSETGGPWVKPNEAMKKYVWSRTIVSGPAVIDEKLPDPPTKTGVFQDLGLGQVFVLPPIHGSRPGVEKPARIPFTPPTFYKDQAVFAVRISKEEAALRRTRFSVSLNGAAFDAQSFNDGLYEHSVAVDGKSAIEFTYEEPVVISAVTIGFETRYPNGVVQASADGEHWRDLAKLPGQAHIWFGDSPVRTFSFAPTSGRFFRVVLEPPPPPSWDDNLLGVPADLQHKITELNWSANSVNRFEDKAGFGLLYDYEAAATPETSGAVKSSDVVDLTNRLSASGKLSWRAPPGDWEIVRIGYSLTGATNHPASESAEGLEVDKLNKTYVKNFLDGLLQPIGGALGANFGGEGLSYVLLDSWEAGQANWTDGILREFKKRRGYSAQPYLPVLVGRIVDSAAASDKFLWDWRKTLSELMRDRHNKTIADYVHERKIDVYAEAMGTGMGAIADNMALKAEADVPMAEFWFVPPEDPKNQRLYRYVTDVREAASVSNIYGRKITAAESFTTLPEFAPWAQGPKDLKWVADYYAAEGVNQFVIASSVHQPLDDMRPGMNLYEFGQYLTRQDTWAEQSKYWFNYLARLSYMLQLGRHSADVALFLGEGAPATVPFWKEYEPRSPVGYDYDFVDAQSLIKTAKVVNGKLSFPSGAEFAVLALPAGKSALTLNALQKLHELVREGATIIADPVDDSPSLADLSERKRIASLRRDLWGENPADAGDKKFGRGRVIWGRSIESALRQNDIAPDVFLEGASDKADVKWIHRTMGDADIYFIANLTSKSQNFTASFREKEKAPGYWLAEHGDVDAAPFVFDGSRTRIPLSLDAFESVFVVFKGARTADSRDISRVEELSRIRLDKNWKISWPANGGKGADSNEMRKLGSWTEASDAQLREFSGTARYSTSFEFDTSELSAGIHVDIDLGNVEQIAELFVNGEKVGADWIAPYRFDIGDFLRDGRNDLAVEVTNLWANKLLADAARPADETTTATVFRPFTDPKSSIQRLPAGLLGPVYVVTEKRESPR